MKDKVECPGKIKAGVGGGGEEAAGLEDSDI